MSEWTCDQSNRSSMKKEMFDNSKVPFLFSFFFDSTDWKILNHDRWKTQAMCVRVCVCVQISLGYNNSYKVDH